MVQRIFTPCLLVAAVLALNSVKTANARCSSTAQSLSGSGTISTSNYPNNYENEETCYWRLTSTSSYVQLTFTAFRTEPGVDYVQVYDSSTEANRIVILNGGSYSTPITVTSTGPSMYVKFISDESVTFSGFTATFASVTDVTCNSSTCSNGGICLNVGYGGSLFTCRCPPAYQGTTCDDDNIACSSNQSITGSGTIHSPNYPLANYYGGENCRWLLAASTSSQIVLLAFTYFSTEPGSDYVTAYDGSTTSSSGNQFAGDLNSLPSYHSTQRYMLVTFVDAGPYVYPGFSANFSSTTVTAECKTSPTAMTGSGAFSTPGFPTSSQTLTSDCNWLLSAADDYSVVHMTVNSFSSLGSSTLRIYDGSSTSGRLAGTYAVSGTYSSVPILKSSGKYLFVTLSSTSSASAKLSATFHSEPSPYGTASRACVSSPCQNGGTCRETGETSYECSCVSPYNGTNCTPVSTVCASNPCQNGGTCRETGETSYECSCVSPYTGDTCTTDSATCSSPRTVVIATAVLAAFSAVLVLGRL